MRYDTVDGDGKITIRYHGKLLHLGVGRAHNRTEVIALIHNADATVITTDGTVLSEHALNPNHGYQPKRKNG